MLRDVKNVMDSVGFGDAPTVSRRVGKHYECVIPIGADEVAYLTMTDEAYAALGDLCKPTEGKFRLEIKPAIEPATRHKIEDVLKKEGFSIIGGGQMVDGSASDISFEKKGGK